MRYVRIPLDRIGALIGHNGETKKNLEEKTGVKLDINSKLGEVLVDEHNVTDPLAAIKMENIVRAIGRGFSPKHATRLFSDDAELFIFDIRDYVSKRSHIRRLKSRVIGREGKTRQILEELTGSDICIYGHTVSVISDISFIDITKKAVDMLLSGSRHATVYRFVESSMKKLKMEQKLGF